MNFNSQFKTYEEVESAVNAFFKENNHTATVHDSKKIKIRRSFIIILSGGVFIKAKKMNQLKQVQEKEKDKFIRSQVAK